MKQKIRILFVMLMLVSLVACSKETGNQASTDMPDTQETQQGTESTQSTEDSSKETETATESETKTETESENSQSSENSEEITNSEQVNNSQVPSSSEENKPADTTPNEIVIADSVLWIANCNDYINLRASAKSDGAVICKIPAGGKMELLGWNGVYAKVSYNGREGYVSANYIKPGSDSIFQSSLNQVEITATYTYEELMKDAKALAAAYPNLITLGSIGTSELGRDLPVIRIGNVNAKYHVLLHGGIHAREHMTSWLLMAMVDYWADNNILSYGDVCYHIIPMVNPDGVVISQTGVLTEFQEGIYQYDLNSGYVSGNKANYTATWKANGLGVDLNRNFPPGWDSVAYHSQPSSWRYKGETAFSAAETIALRDYTLAYDFDVTISYHATGSLIYYAYGYKQEVNALSKSLGNAVKDVSGYPLHGWSGPTDGAGYKDWAMDTLGIPSLTVEIGCASAPLAERETYSIFARNSQVLPAIAKWLQR